MSRGGFDKAITIFSPEGRLYQVEYALKAAQVAGFTTIAICGKDSACVVTQKKVPDKLIKPESLTSMYQLDENLGCCATGRVPDARAVVNETRQEAFEYAYKVGIPIPVGTLAKRVADEAQVWTQHNSKRAMGVTLTILGMDKLDTDGSLVPKVYKADPSGFYVSLFASASGKKENEAQAWLEKKFKQTEGFDRLTEIQVQEFCLSCIQQVLGESLKAKDVEMACVSVRQPKFHLISDADVEKMLTALAERDE